jgi:hypothetical protein
MQLSRLRLRRLLLALLLLASPGLGHVPRALADDIVDVAPRSAPLAVTPSRAAGTKPQPRPRARRRVVARQASSSRSLRAPPLVTRVRRASSSCPAARRTRLHLQLCRLLR